MSSESGKIKYNNVMKEKLPKSSREISGKDVKRVTLGAGAGAFTGAAENYIGQRKKIIEDLSEAKTGTEKISREVVVFERVDKKEVGKAALKGAVKGGLEEIVRSSLEKKRPQQKEVFNRQFLMAA